MSKTLKTLPSDGSAIAASKTTLQNLLKALPGELRITANFPERSVAITQSEDARKAHRQKAINHFTHMSATLTCPHERP